MRQMNRRGKKTTTTKLYYVPWEANYKIDRKKCPRWVIFVHFRQRGNALKINLKDKEYRCLG